MSWGELGAGALRAALLFAALGAVASAFGARK